MSAFKTFLKMLKNDPGAISVALLNRAIRSGMTNIIPDKAFLKLTYRIHFKEKLNLKAPETFNQKLQWLKLYNRNPEYITMVDKYEVRKYISKSIGEEYLIPCLGVWENPDEINYDSLPDKFVLKCTHDSGSVMICDKESLDKIKIKKFFTKKLKKNMFWWGREWPYKNLKPRIIAEEYMEDESGELRDYKLMCFNGKVKCAFVCSDRFSNKGLHVTFFDNNWNVMPFERSFPSVKEGVARPINYNTMIQLAEQLAASIPFVRVDFYEINGKIYFGELTFFPGNGTEAFQPKEWDYTLGQWIELPPKDN